MHTEAEKRRITKQVAKQLSKIAQIADEYELTLPNGAEIGNMLEGIANDLRLYDQS